MRVFASAAPRQDAKMSPTVFCWRDYRFSFSREESRMRVPVFYCADGEAKVWIEPEVSLARNYGLSEGQLMDLLRVVEERRDDIAAAWNGHFRS